LAGDAHLAGRRDEAWFSAGGGHCAFLDPPYGQAFADRRSPRWSMEAGSLNALQTRRRQIAAISLAHVDEQVYGDTKIVIFSGTRAIRVGLRSLLSSRET
jgi:hypothetical protein